MENDSMTPQKQSIVDIPDFMKKPQETRMTISETVLQELLKHEYRKGDIDGWMCGFFTGILVPLIMVAVLMTLGII